MIFGLNTTSDIPKLLYIISRAVRQVKCGTILKYHKWDLCQMSLQMMLLPMQIGPASSVSTSNKVFLNLQWPVKDMPFRD